MVERLTHSIDLKALGITLAICAGFFAAGIWALRKATGRRVGDLVALLTAAIVLIFLTMPIIVFFGPGLNSPDRETHAIVFWMAEFLFAALALLVTWYFNRLLRRRRNRSRRPRAEEHPW